MIKILMTGAGAPGGPGVLRCLEKCKNYEVVTADANEISSGKYLSKNFIKIPMATDKNFIEKILDLCINLNIKVIFPLVTKELFLFSKNLELFSNQGIRIIVSKYNDLLIANNKSSLYKHLQSKNISVPKFRVVKNFNEFVDATESKTFNKEYCMKPSISNGSRGVRLVKNEINELNLLFNHKPNNIYTTHNDLKRILKNDNFPELLISEILPGDEYTIDVLVCNEKPIIILPRIRTKTNSGISVAGKFKNNIKIIEYSKQVINSMRLNGPIGIQVKEDDNGEFKILEINPRIQGTSVAALGCGINLPVLAVKNVLEEEITLPEIKWDTSFIRYYNEVYF